jgi:hypothetical protein
MKLLTPLVLGAAAGIILPLLFRDGAGALGRIATYAVIHPVPGLPQLSLSLPVFLFTTLMAALLMSWADR